MHRQGYYPCRTCRGIFGENLQANLARAKLTPTTI
jgi:hypothetical protein